MRLHLDPSHKGLHEFVKKLPTLFERGEGTVLHAGRNTIRLLAQEGELLAAKRFRQPGALQGILYAHIRRSKARRSFEHPYGSSASASGRRSRLPGVNTAERGV